MLAEKGGRDGTRAKGGMAHEPAEERQVARDTLDDRRIEGELELRDRVVAIAAVCDQLGDQRVVREPDLVALLDPGVDPDSGGQGEPVNRARLGEERLRILGVQARLDRMPRRGDIQLDGLTGSDAQLQLDDVEPCRPPP